MTPYQTTSHTELLASLAGRPLIGDAPPKLSRVHSRENIKAAKSGKRCENRKCRHKITDINRLDTHHLQSKGAGGGDERSNLMALCRACHTDFHNKPGFKADILEQAAARNIK